MKIENQVCTLSQAKRLFDLGIQLNSQFGWCWNGQFMNGDGTEGFFVNTEEDVFNGWAEAYCAYTTSELAAALPDAIEDKQGTPFVLEIGKAHYTYSVQYWDRCSSDSKGYLLPRTRDPLLSVCMADMLIHLLENNHVTPDEINARL